MEGYRCGARGDTSKETLRAESPCVGAAVLCRAEARAPRARTAARGSAQGPEPTSTGAPRSASAPRAAPRPALPPSSAEAAAVPRGGAGPGGMVGSATARPDEGRPERGPALLLSASRADLQRRGGARWRPGWGRGCWPWPWGRQVRGGHGGRRGRGWARLVLLPRGRAEAWSSPSVPGSGWELCVGGGGCVGTRMLRERPCLSRQEEGVWAVPLAWGLWQEGGSSQL